MTAVVEFTVYHVHETGRDEALGNGHFEVGKDFGSPGKPCVLWPDEDSARTAATGYAQKLQADNFPAHFLVRRITSEIVWDGF